MGKYIVKRVLQVIPVFLGVTLILFALRISYRETRSS